MASVRVAAPTMVIALLVFACGGQDAAGGDADPPVTAGGDRNATAAAPRSSGAPEVEERYQERIDEAWAEAVAGEDPSATCAGVKGRAAAAAPGSADRALAACNVEIPTRYFLTFLDGVEAGEKTCNNLAIELVAKLPAMTVSTEGFRDLAAREERADTSDAAAAASGAAAMAGAVATAAGSDSQDVVRERLRARVTELCPQHAGAIFR